jgi:predicted transcriptional regulator
MSTMGRPKEEVQRLLETLPEESSFEDIHYHIYVQQAIQRGLESASRGELVEQDEIDLRTPRSGFRG